MKVIHALEPLAVSIMLLGPTPRRPAPGMNPTPSWRPAALGILERLEFDGTVFVPEASDWAQHDHYDAQVAWEWEALDQATVSAFWIPRELVTMPAFTSNVEFGYKVASGRVLLGYPEDAPKMTYLAALAERFHAPVYHDLDTLLAHAVSRAYSLRDASVRKSYAD
jgi:hypothetical protein